MGKRCLGSPGHLPAAPPRSHGFGGDGELIVPLLPPRHLMREVARSERGSLWTQSEYFCVDRRYRSKSPEVARRIRVASGARGNLARLRRYKSWTIYEIPLFVGQTVLKRGLVEWRLLLTLTDKNIPPSNGPLSDFPNRWTSDSLVQDPPTGPRLRNAQSFKSTSAYPTKTNLHDTENASEFSCHFSMSAIANH